ncbi:phenylalanine--tRNA ligase subunit alpha [Candidatus Similichlamydia epinepheli]|uniref:tRNA ligase subunit PheS family protein n=1 Tax=Candidatus Similichlamydia epinepheli TaxID=1903953 RepID=UPI000D3DA3B8|nr:phenylalanine--tRNA ligase subunit alpha [Candidatus Similichlamydia epinepheli]
MKESLSLSSVIESVREERFAFDKQISIVGSSENEKEALKLLRVRFLGRKSVLSSLIRSIGQLAEGSDRLQAGKILNEQKTQIEELISEAELRIEHRELTERISAERVDMTLPGRTKWVGSAHPLLETLFRALEILSSMGFSVRFGEEIGPEEVMFDLLNFPKSHPARLEQDTYYLPGGSTLRSQTSNAQVLLMRSQPPPIRFVVPGKCFRNEEVSSRSLSVFHQIEGLYVDRDVRLGDLLSTLEVFYASFLGKSNKLRFRSSYFPFVEPGIEVDISKSWEVIFGLIFISFTFTPC